MTSRLRIALIAAGATVASLQPALLDSPPVQPALVTPPARPPSVRIEHELVPAAIIEEAAPRRLRAAAPRVSPPTRRPAQAAGLVSRARRLLVGDGRYKPEPFPRANR